jgi:Uma2 family endonuclease
MASLPNAKLVTYEEWLELPEERNEEIVNGEIRIMPMAKFGHAMIVTNLNHQLFGQLDRKKYVVLTGSWGLVIQPEPLTCRAPDLAVFERSAIREVDGYIRSAPDLLVEVLSPRNTPKDIRLKTVEYSSLGVPEFWIVNPDRRNVEILLFEDGHLRRKTMVTEGALRPVRLPGVSIDIEAIWRV